MRTLLFAGLLALVSLGVSGCASMKDADGTDLPWTDRQGWELQPNLPGSMMGQ
jgi:hypothetical protein